MKKILLKIDEDVLKELTNYCNVKAITGSFGGIADIFIRRLIENIDGNKKEWYCHYKNKEDNKWMKQSQEK